MRVTLKPILITILLLTALSAQFRSDVQTGKIPTNLNGELDSQQSLSLFDSQRFDMSHGFTMSMVSDGQNMYSMAGLTNRISYLAMDNLKIDANVTLFKSQSPFQQQGKLIDQLDLAYDAGITYKPTKNSFLQLRFQNLPHSQRYQTPSPFNMRFIQ
jgi:hypothetical protein